jgi:hypothetical protein
VRFDPPAAAAIPNLPVKNRRPVLNALPPKWVLLVALSVIG